MTRTKPHIQRINTTFGDYALGFPPTAGAESSPMSVRTTYSDSFFRAAVDSSPGYETSPTTPAIKEEHLFRVPFPSFRGPYISRPKQEHDASFLSDGPLNFVVPSQAIAAGGLTTEDSIHTSDNLDSEEAEDTWSLVPYNVPWGSSYCGYKKGTLPGPDGKAIFLRSPTPLKNQRTGQACERCRERKAKVLILCRYFGRMPLFIFI